MSFEWQFSVTTLPEPTGVMALGGFVVLVLSRRARRCASVSPPATSDHTPL
jgi:hypothetical protein